MQSLGHSAISLKRPSSVKLREPKHQTGPSSICHDAHDPLAPKDLPPTKNLQKRASKLRPTRVRHREHPPTENASATSVLPDSAATAVVMSRTSIPIKSVSHSGEEDPSGRVEHDLVCPAYSMTGTVRQAHGSALFDPHWSGTVMKPTMIRKSWKIAEAKFADNRSQARDHSSLAGFASTLKKPVMCVRERRDAFRLSTSSFVYADVFPRRIVSGKKVPIGLGVQRSSSQSSRPSSCSPPPLTGAC